MENAHARQLTSIETFARAGHAARGIVYILLGYLALSTAKSEGTTGVLKQIEEMPAGQILLAIVGLGLACWGVFRLYGAAVDIQGKGTDAKGMGARIGHALSGAAHLVFCYLAFKLVLSSGGGGDGGSAAKSEAAATASSLPMGGLLIGLVAVGFVLAALSQFTKAVTGDFEKLLDPQAPDATLYLGRIGYAARGVVFLAIAWQVAQVAFGSGSAGQAGIGGALDALRETQWLYYAVAGGLILFGVFSLLLARYRLIRDTDLLSRLPGGL